ncbi:carbohydrate-binding family 9-like protein [Cytophagaceae bacterium DM2B3-1]|uniref:Carbohydrate-binding family 9-like protein n=1 Tax=Xanthocytophaga flava TaxID=3048013 RepID=A0ABT7CGH8_9BACT|nr:carbohydrate-binding family 9-like protein [Xanthocytophaga flavus]MDJ1492621.1 carbohydrate-binding family 9-like protein [Xanthocytophaga flavus]
MRFFFLASFFGLLYVFSSDVFAFVDDSTKTVIRKTSDFTITGDGKSKSWEKTEWIKIPVLESAGDSSSTLVKLLYSDTGLYFLFQCQDQKLTATIQKDFGALFNEDVVEVFLWPDPSVPIYFEYELSPLNYELPLLVPNINGRLNGWLPAFYERKQRTQHATTIQGGTRKSLASVTGWTAEFFIPYRLLSPLVSASPKSGDRWRGNLYRIDYDKVYTTWTWSKVSVYPNRKASFHEYQKFGTWIFE